MRIGVDIDGVCYDWVASVHRHLDTSRSELVEQINEAIGPDFDREWKSWTHYKTWPLDTPTFLALCNEATNEGTMFSLGEPSLGARRAIDRIRDAGHDIVFVTARNFGDPGVAQAKTLTWLKTYGLYVEGIDELHFAEDKTTFDLDYLVDDRVETLRAVDAMIVEDETWPQHIAVRFRQPWNEEMLDEVDVVESMDEFADLVLDEGAWAPAPRQDYFAGPIRTMQSSVHYIIDGPNPLEPLILGTVDPEFDRLLVKEAEIDRNRVIAGDYDTYAPKRMPPEVRQEQSHPWIALSGRKRSGKDTVGSYLVERYGFTKVSFAEPLKSMALAIDPVVDAEGYDNDLIHLSKLIEAVGWERAKDRYPEVRRFLQRLGTEGVRNHLGQDVWVELAERTAREIDGPVVFCDTRFPNEAEMVRRNGGQIWRIERPSSAAGDPHPSESALDDWPFGVCFYNRGTIEDLIENLEEALAEDDFPLRMGPVNP